MKRVLVVGSGGREHALGFRLSLDKADLSLYFAPGNPGSSKFGTNVEIGVDEIDKLLEFAKDNKIDLTIIGPELPLSLGVVDRFQQAGLICFGPTKAAAQMEASKNFAKEVMVSADVPTAKYGFFTELFKAKEALNNYTAPYVIKADGLAAGKGVIVTESFKEAEAALDDIFSSGSHCGVVIEEFMAGREASFIVMTDGERVVPLPTAHDYKRVGDGDTGPNTGGMGTVSPTPNLTLEQEQFTIEKIIKPTLKELKKRGISYLGFLYAGLMVEPSGSVRVVEFNARLGDPETQVLMRRFNGSLFGAIYALATGNELPEIKPADSLCCVCVVMASENYPVSSCKGEKISGIEKADGLGGVVVFHAGTSVDSNNNLITNGGRILGVTATAETQHEARLKAYQAVEMIGYKGARFRRDIGEEGED